jgi:nitrogen fixation protein FixH
MTDRYIPWLFGAGMLVVVLANAVLIFYATTSWSGMATGRAYERGLAYNRALNEATRQETLGWQLEAALEPAIAGTRLIVRASDRDARPLAGLRIAATLERPLGREAPYRVELRPAAEGYAVLLPSLASGQWQLRLAATRGADVRNVAQRLVIP